MNRKQWYKQRRLYRLKRLVYQSQGDYAGTKEYEAVEHFPYKDIKDSVNYGSSSTSGYNIPEMFGKKARILELYPDRVQDYYDTLRYAMRSNANMARISACGATPFDYLRGFR